MALLVVGGFAERNVCGAVHAVQQSVRIRSARYEVVAVWVVPSATGIGLGLDRGCIVASFVSGGVL